METRIFKVNLNNNLNHNFKIRKLIIKIRNIKETNTKIQIIRITINTRDSPKGINSKINLGTKIKDNKISFKDIFSLRIININRTPFKI